MKASQLERWLKRVYATRETEILCSECFDLLSAYIDLELSGQDAQARLPLVRAHLEQCKVCHEEYELVRDLARATGDQPEDETGAGQA